MSDVTYKSTHYEEALARLAEQYKDKPRIASLIEAFAVQIQELELELFDMLTQSAIADAEGSQLADIGDIVGQPSNGMAEPEYRTFISARILANRSTGKLAELVIILDTILSNQAVPPSTEIAAWEQYPASVTLEAYEVTSDPLIIWRDFLDRAVAAGVRIFFSSNSAAMASSLIAEDANGDFIPTSAQSCSDANGDFDGGTTNNVFG